MFIEQITNNKSLFIGMDVIACMMMLPIIAALLREVYSKKQETKLLIYTFFGHIIVCLANLHSWMFEGHAEKLSEIMICDAIAFSFAMLDLFLFMCYEVYLLRKRTYISDWVTYFVAFICGSTVIIMVIGMFQPNPWFLGYTSEGTTYYTSAYMVPYLLTLLVMVFGAVLTWSCRNVVSYTELFAFLSYLIFPILGGVLDGITNGSSVYSMGSLMLLMVYVNIHIETIRQETINEKELAQSKAKLMISQIQPHFMYNSLNSIYYLIDEDPELAQEAVSTFSDYLRQNVNSLRNDNPVKFSEEIGHTKAYLSLEQLRFGDRLNVEFNLGVEDFDIPALSVQPLVENAVKHGVMKKVEGGRISISSEERAGKYVITIADDGVGFKSGEFKDGDKHTHVGIENVKKRIESMVGGSLFVKSTPGEGTVCTITIPKERRHNE